MKNVVLWNSFVVGGLFSFVKKINVMQIFEFYRKQVKEKEERVSEGLVDILFKIVVVCLVFSLR